MAANSISDGKFAERVLAWFDLHGRHDLPWQADRSLYHVWLSEIMLQQTQVATVIPYYQKFLQHFPDLESLANASVDEVLILWAGLGYYTRARNLHKAAVHVQHHHAGRFPKNFDEVISLPGIGRSTAGAILAQSLGQRHAILDGNVKRVLCRYYAIEGWPGRSSVEKILWEKAEACTPPLRLADYTQAMMDLGATLCKRGKPLCNACPLADGCLALKNDCVKELPTRKASKTLPVKSTRMLLLTNPEGAVLLEKRPPSGIWGGMWSLPELAIEDNVLQCCQQRWGLNAEKVSNIESFRHTFSHYHLDISPCSVQVIVETPTMVQECSAAKWVNFEEISEYALSTPVAGILNTYRVANTAE